MSQLSLFSAAAREPQLGDLEGLLAGPGQVVRRGDDARISVVVAQDWRVEALVGELAELRVEAEIEPARSNTVTVRTPWLAELRPVADGWTHGSLKLPPAGWTLDGARLRWWCLAAGSGSSSAAGALYNLALGPSDEPAWQSVGAALAAAGVPGVLVGPRADGPAYRIVGRRRLTRLCELVGEAPHCVPREHWPAPDGPIGGAA
jgi:hypothetical protein